MPAAGSLPPEPAAYTLLSPAFVWFACHGPRHRLPDAFHGGFDLAVDEMGERNVIHTGTAGTTPAMRPGSHLADGRMSGCRAVGRGAC